VTEKHSRPVAGEVQVVLLARIMRCLYLQQSKLVDNRSLEVWVEKNIV